MKTFKFILVVFGHDSMKKTALFFIILMGSYFINSSVMAQEKKNSLTASGIAVKYRSIEDKDYNWDRHHGYYGVPRPGVELVYMRAISRGFKLGTGITYQRGKASSYVNDRERIFKFNDVCFLLLLKKYFNIKTYNHLYFTTGIYFGKTKNIKAFWPNSFGWQPWKDYNLIENYSDDINYSDLYFDFGYHTSLKKTLTFSFAPFLKYRLNPTWLNYHQNKLHYGIKVNYALNF